MRARVSEDDIEGGWVGVYQARCSDAKEGTHVQQD